MARKWWEIPAVLLLMLALAVISTYPLIRYFDTGIPYAPFWGATVWNRSGDQIQLLYWFWLVKENFIGAVPFDTNPYEFNMVMAYETSGLNTIPLAFLYMLFSPLGDVAAYNCTILSSYVLAGVFMYLLVYLYSGSRAGALLGAVIFTFAPSRINGFTAGHGYGLLYFCYPFILYFLEKGIRAKKIRYGFLSGLGLIGLSMLEPHLIYYICVFLALYIPVRCVALLPVSGDTLSPGRDGAQGLLSWSVPRSLFTAWGAGVAAVLYAQLLFSCRDQQLFFSPSFWWVLILYPFIPILIALCFSSLYQRLSSLRFQESFALEAGSLLPLYLLLPLAGLACINRPVDTATVVAAAVVLVVIAKLSLLRKHLRSMVQVLADGLARRKSQIWPILPVLISLGGIVVWIASAKINMIASTIAGGGRTLDDVGLYSSRLSDLFLSTSNVYIGIVPAVLAGSFLLALLLTLLLNRPQERFGQESELIALFYAVVAFFCYILALGLAFGKTSLYVLFYHYFPFFNYPRVSDRIITLVLFALAIVAGFVVQGMQRRCRTRVALGVVTVLVVGASVLQLKDYNVLKPMGINILDQGQDIYTHVQENIGDGRLLEIPLWPGDSHQSSLYQHYIMLDRVPRINGSSPLVLTEYIDTVFEPLASINQGRFYREQFELLHQLGVKFITVHDNRDVFLEKVSPFEPLTTVRRLKNSPYLEFVDIDNMMYFKTWKGRNVRLYLFRVKNKETIVEDAEQAWYDMPYFYSVNSRLHQQIGEIVEDKTTGRKVFQATEGKDKPGFLVYGPYDVYSPGAYRCYFTLKTSADPATAVARLEVVRVAEDGEVTVLAQAEVTGPAGNSSYRKEYLDFSLAEKEKLEFRVFYYGKGQVRVEKVSVNKKGSDSPLYFLEAEKMVGDIGQLVFAEDASGGKAVEAGAGKSNNGDLVYGPNRIYAKGRYAARFYLRMKEAGNITETDVVAMVSVTDGQDLSIFAQRNVLAGELGDNSFTGIDAAFEVSRDEELSFHVRSTDKVDLQLDAIEILMQHDDQASHE